MASALPRSHAFCLRCRAWYALLGVHSEARNFLWVGLIAHHLAVAVPDSGWMIRFLIVFCWCKYHEIIGTPLLIHENVRGFPETWARLLLQSYHIIVLEVSPGDVGFKMVRRPRQYLCCIHT